MSGAAASAYLVDGAPAGFDAFRARALDPRRSVVVSACAGAGKTTLLVGRIVRALLDGCPPDAILAVTFTRRAAAEMRARLMRALRRLARRPEAEVLATLRALSLDEAGARAALPMARTLLDRVLTHPRPPTITTFHSWFWQLVRLAPGNDALLPEDVSLADATGQLADAARLAWLDALVEAGRAGLRADYEALVAEIGRASLDGALDAAMLRRVELLTAAGEGMHADAARCAAAAARLAGEGFAALASEVAMLLGGTVGADPDDIGRALGTDAVLRDAMAAQIALLDGQPGRCAAACVRLRQALAALADTGSVDSGPAADRLRDVARDHEGAPRPWPVPIRRAPALRRAIEGAGGEAACRDAWAAMIDRADRWVTLADELRALRLNAAMLRLALDRVAHFQAFKRRLRAVDFGDVELLAAGLVRDETIAAQVQAKLDARYRQVLFDEFQDTNALQWRIVADWLSGYAGGGARPSVFVVGDAKQAIYRFRRADARVFGAARRLLRDVFGASWLETDVTWRIAPAVLEHVNHAMARHPAMPAFRPHVTRRGDDGLAWRLPLAADVPPDEGAAARDAASGTRSVRDWLLAPRKIDAGDRHFVEGLRIAEAIREARARLGATGDVPRWRDVLVLARSRTHFARYEQALRHAGIPVLSDRAGGLLERLEVADLLAVLRWIARPSDDLSLAQALRSPLFDVDEAGLARVALRARETGGRWGAALAEVAASHPGLARAHPVLEAWRAFSRRATAHALLDRIVAERDAPLRYAAVVPPPEREVVRANIEALLLLALDVGVQGRPGVGAFLDALRRMRRLDERDAPSEGMPDGVDAVRLQTIHGAKGLEADIVVLADAHRPPSRERGWRPLVGWPPDEPLPRHFSFVHGERDHPGRRAWLAEEAEAAAVEDANLLYVATTRARRALVVAGSTNRHAGADAWWHRLDGLPPMPAPPAASVTAPETESDPFAGFTWNAFAPVAMPESSPDTGRDPREEVLARCLARMAAGDPPPACATGVRARAKALLALPALRACLADAARALEAVDGLDLFDADGCPLRIDRWVRHADAGWIVEWAWTVDDDRLARARAALAARRRALAALHPGLPLHTLLAEAATGRTWSDPDIPDAVPDGGARS